MLTYHERLALMAGITLHEASKNAYKIKTVKIRLSDLGLAAEDFTRAVVDEAVSNQSVLNIEDWKVEDGYLVFYPSTAQGGDISVSDAAQFRQEVGEFVKSSSTDSAVQEKHLTPAELKKREEIAKALEKQDPGMNMGKKMAIATAQAKRVAENADSAIGWYVLDDNDKPVAGPMSESAAHAKCKQLGGDEKGYTVSYTSDYSARRAHERDTNESTGSNKVFDEYSEWKKAAEHGGCEIYASGAASGKYEARKQKEVCGKFDKDKKDGWLHSSVVKEDVAYDEEGNVIPEAPLPQGLADIARTLGFSTLDTRNSSSLDFKEVGAANVKMALLAAYNLGKTQGTAQVTPAASQPQSSGLPRPTPHTSADHQQVAPAGR